MFRAVSASERAVVSFAIAVALALIPAVRVLSAVWKASTISVSESSATGSTFDRMLLIWFCRFVSAASKSVRSVASTPVARVVSAAIASAFTCSAAAARAASFVIAGLVPLLLPARVSCTATADAISALPGAHCVCEILLSPLRSSVVNS